MDPLLATVAQNQTRSSADADKPARCI